LLSDLIWIFERSGERLEIRRHSFPEGPQLTVVRDGDSRSYQFADANGLVNFQNDMEAMLVQTGWSFVEFSPDQRAGRDRRGWPRMPNDRRRWWTDGVQQAESDARPHRRRR
jgi:hypothetical protein